MNKVVLSFCFVLFFLGMATNLEAQPSQKLVNVIVSPDHADWRYKVNEEVTFTVQVYKNENLLKNVMVDYEFGPEFFPTTQKQDVVLKDGKTILKSSMKVPGFLRCKVVAKVDGKNYEGLATAAYDEDKIIPTTQTPEDFDEFWTKVIADARNIPLDPKKVLLPDRCTSTQNVYEISFQNDWYGSRIYGILITPKKQGKYPAILQVPGAGIRPYRGANYGDDVISLEIGIHGVPVTMPQEVYNNLMSGGMRDYWKVNMNNKDSHYYKRVFLGCVRAVDFIYSLSEFNGETVGVTGGSQGGALSIITAALEPRIKFLAAYYPAMCDFAGYLNSRAGGWPHYYQNAKPAENEVATLSYFDVVNFARRVKVPGWYSWGYNDVVCPPTSMYAAYNVIPGTKELHLFLETGHWTYPEQHEACSAWMQKQYNK
ncbi:MAG: acetylxylan esterase [Tannerellaceae bacterium]|jgi:cephalosporin-C deacetylase-like acetyl esterase|nr:acetylxylan esterase [Tannerellaceae bacterium]